LTGDDESEVVVCDTTYISRLAKAARYPNANRHWLTETIARLAQATLTISVITVAELRAGMAHEGWSEQRRASAEHRLGAYTWIPLDAAIIDKWAEIQAQALKAGLSVGHNDIWIGATAVVRGYPLVSCDIRQCQLPQVGENVIYLPSEPGSAHPVT
jgi:predicted nucleic acid-binding protein